MKQSRKIIKQPVRVFFPKLQTIALVLILMTLVVPFQKNTDTGTSEFKVWFISGLLLAPLVFLIVVVVQKFYTGKYGAMVRIETLLVGAALVGGLKGAGTQILVNFLLENQAFLVPSIFVRAYSGAVLFVGVTFTLAILATYKMNLAGVKSALDQRNQEIALDIASLGKEIDLLRSEARDTLILKVLNDLGSEKLFELNSSDPRKNWLQIARKLNDDLAQKVRLKSYDLVRYKMKSSSIKDTLSKILSFEVLHLHPFVFAIVRVTLSPTLINPHQNFNRNLLHFIATLISSYSLTYLFKVILEKRKQPSSEFKRMIFLAVTISNFIGYGAIQYFVWGSVNMYYYFGGYLWTAFLIYLISYLSEMTQSLERYRVLSQSVQSDLLDKQRILLAHQERLRENLSKHLHGYLMAKISSTSQKLSKFEKEGDLVGYENSLNELISEFSLERFQEGLLRDEFGPDFYQLTQESWDGLLEISFEGDLEFYSKLHRSQRIEIADVVEELLLNSSRHGQATKITVDFTWLSDTELKICARDDGSGPKKNMSNGLGSKLFYSASDGRFSVTPGHNGGCQTELFISLYDSSSEIPELPSVGEVQDPPVRYEL